MSKRWAISCLNIHTVPFTILTSTMGLPISSSVICMYPLSIIILLGGGRISYLYLVIYGSGRIYIVYLTGMLLLIRGGTIAIERFPLLWSFCSNTAMSWLNFRSTTRAYICVVWIFVCPNILETLSIGTPCVKQISVAKVWHLFCVSRSITIIHHQISSGSLL